MILPFLIMGGCSSYGKYPDESKSAKWAVISKITPRPKPKKLIKKAQQKKGPKSVVKKRKIWLQKQNSKFLRTVNSLKSVKVAPKDTVYAISRRHRVTLRSLIQANNLRPPYHLRIGQHLKLPIFKKYKVRKGDTVYGLARSHGFDIQTFAKLNGLKHPYRLNLGQEVKVSFLHFKKRKTLNQLRRQKLRAQKVTGKKFTAQTRKYNKFIWPVKGRILSSYGLKAHGLYNDGINILSKVGMKVRSSDHGVVVHAARILKGYGNLILIKHSNGWLTAYAHNSRLLVKKGQKIARGQIIAEIGSTGRVKRPQLHFEIRRHNNSLNPMKHLPKI
jgi:murein DD-endopeptidase MepM/ murein hydrolase activator NlpD